MLHLESCSYNKSHPSTKFTASLRLMLKSLSLFVSNPYLTFLNSGCTSSTPTQVDSLIRVYHRAMSLWLRKCPLQPFRSNSAFVLTQSIQYPTWCQSTFRHCHHDLAMPSCIHHVQLSKIMTSPIVPDIDSVWKF
jgi:hypothetical protein